MSETIRLKLPEIAAAQAQKHVTHNEALSLLDALVHLSVLSRMLATPPTSPAEGDRYLIAPAATGAWAGHDGQVAFRLDGVWRFAAPVAGWRLWSLAEHKLFAFTGAGWQDVAALSELQNLSLLGVNTTANATNKLAVASPASLFTHAGNGHQIKVNKAAASDTASLLFQDNFSARAEFGLTGDDHFHVKVSPDGSTFTEAIVIDKTSGQVSVKTAEPITDVFTASGTWTKRVGAKWVRVVIIGASSGGGSGRRGAAASARSGGTGSHNGLGVQQTIAAALLGATETVTIGAGGAGGAAVTADSTSGNDGALGGTTSFGAHVSCPSTSAGLGGGTSAASQGAVIVGTLFNGNGAQNASITAQASASFTSVGPSSGAAGGSISTGNAAFAGADAGQASIVKSAIAGGAGGANTGVNGGNGTAISDPSLQFGGSGGGGGGASTTGAAGAGGNGGAPGGGGGGGASLNGNASGKGGDGARGEVRITTYF